MKANINDLIDAEIKRLGAIGIDYNRRRYGRTTFTWPILLFAGNRNDEEFAGDPWPCINVPKKELLAALVAYKGMEATA